MEHPDHPYLSTRVSSSQIVKIADFMEKHPELANVNLRGLDYTLSYEEELWEELADSVNLNAEIFNGGCFQPAEKWKTWWKNYAFSLNKRYLSNLKKLSQTKILTTSDARLLKVMGRDLVQKIWNAEQKLLNSASGDQNVPGLKKEEEFGIKIKSCFTLKKSEKSKTKTNMFTLPNATTTSQRKFASCTITKRSEKCQATQTCDPFSDAQRRAASSTTVKTSTKSQATQTCDSFAEAVAIALQKAASCSTLKTNGKSQATQTCDPFSYSIAAANQKSASNTVLKTKSQIKLTCDPFPDASAQQKLASYSILKTSKNSLAKQTWDPNKKNADAIPTVLQKSASDINPSPLKSPTLQRISANSPIDNIFGEQNGSFTPKGTTAEALLAIASEINIESTLAKQKIELKQERLRLHKRKVAAVQFISKKICLF